MAHQSAHAGDGAPPKLKFMRPSDDASWEEDKPDIDTTSGTTFIFNPCISLTLQKQRERLPIAQYRNHIIYLLEKYQTLVLVGETGCGKSTQIPQYLLESGWAKKEDGKMIGVTQPRRVASTTLASRVADETGTFLGQEVGYSIRFDEKCDPNLTRIKYMTEGLLIREMMGNPLLRQYAVIMLDEIHERTLNSDILMGLLRKILKKRKDLKLIISSATVDAEEIQSFFNLKLEKEGQQNPKGQKPKSRGEEDTATILSVAGRNHPIEIYHSASPVANYVAESVNTALKIHENEGRGDILVFLTGQEEVDTAVSMLNDRKLQLQSVSGRNKMDDLLVLPMYGSLPPRDQLKVFQTPPRGTRKIVIATNIAETSITISGIVFVIDCGFVKMRWFNSQTLTDALVVVPVSKASAIQRAGRAGRTQRGKVYRLYPEEEYDQLLEASPPEIQRCDLSLTVLHLKAMGIDDIVHFKFPSPPPAANLVCAVELLYALGALDRDGELTKPLGEQMAEFPLPPTLSKMLLISEEFGCSEEIITIVSMLQVESVFTTPYGSGASKARIEKRKFEVSEGDLITLLNVFKAFQAAKNKAKSFCSQHFLNYKRLKRATELRIQIAKMLHRFNVKILSCGQELEPILKCITAGLFPNAVYLHYSGSYRTVRGDEVVNVHPSSVLYTIPQPQWILFHEIVHTGSQVHIRDLTVVQPEWLQQLAPHFYAKTTERDHS